VTPEGLALRLASGSGMQETKFSDLTFLGGESVFARFFARPFKRFLAVEAAGGVMLLIATAVALIWVNSPWGDSYDAFWGVPVNLSVNGIEIFEGHTLADFVNDALMALFFFVASGCRIGRHDRACCTVFCYQRWKPRRKWLGHPHGNRHCLCGRHCFIAW
jgi:hypothetical protein